MTNRVLVPLDGSTLAESALRYLDVLKGAGFTELRLVCVAEDLSVHGVPEAASFQDRQVHLFHEYLGLKEAELSPGWSGVTAVVRRGDPAQKLLEEIDNYHPDLVLLATHGQSGLHRFRMGSVADKVVRTSPSNVFVVGPQPAAWPFAPPITSVLVPLDGSPLSAQALPVAKQFASGLNLNVLLIRVIDSSARRDDFSGYVLRLLKEEGPAYLLEMAATFEAPGKVELAIEAGSPTEQILDYLKDHQIGLVVATSHGRGGLLRTALGSTTDRLITGPAPVLIVKARAASETAGDRPDVASSYGLTSEAGSLRTLREHASEPLSSSPPSNRSQGVSLRLPITAVACSRIIDAWPSSCSTSTTSTTGATRSTAPSNR